MNHMQAQSNLLAALESENDGIESQPETNSNFIEAVGSNRRMFPGWSRKLEAAFKQWAATELNLLIVRQKYPDAGKRFNLLTGEEIK